MTEIQKNPEPQNIAAPTIGRLVYVFSAVNTSMRDITKPMVGIVTDVIDAPVPTDPSDVPYVAPVPRINAAVFENSGNMIFGGRQHVPHASAKGGEEVWWDWMPYQKGQAAKTDALEAAMANSVSNFAHGGPATST